MERLTEKHYGNGNGYYVKCSETCHSICCDGCERDAEPVDRLGQIEDILGDTYDLDRLTELVESDKAGRVKIIHEYTEKACGDCAHFMRIKGTCRGKCEIKPFTPRRNMSDRTTFEPAQSRKACKQYKRKDE